MKARNLSLMPLHNLHPHARMIPHAGQFNIGQHGLCWIHAERLVHKLDAFTEHSRSNWTCPGELLPVSWTRG
jgi:hypothetical protein